MKSIPTLIASIVVGSSTIITAAVTATDDFSSGNLAGGTNWSNNWSGGTVQTSTKLDSSALFHVGGGAQQFSRRFVQQTNLLDTFTVSFDLAITVAAGQGNYGFRAHMENQQPSVFSVGWKSDLNGGALTFLYGSNQTITVPGPEWNIATNLATVESHTYNFRFDITPQAGQNPGQYIGQYSATVTRSDNLSFSTGTLAWNIGGNGINAGNFDEIVLFNSSSRTTVQYDNFLIGDPALLIPEPTFPILFAMGSLALLRRRRA